MILRTLTAAALGAMLAAASASAQDAKRYRFAYDQPHNTGYGVVGDVFADKLKELSKGTMLIEQYPGAQLGQEPQVLQLVKAGDVEFCISASANAATLSPQAGVMSLHYLFRSEDHLVKALADPGVNDAARGMIEDTVQGAHAIGMLAPGRKSKKQICSHASPPLEGQLFHLQRPFRRPGGLRLRSFRSTTFRPPSIAS